MRVSEPCAATTRAGRRSEGDNCGGLTACDVAHIRIKLSHRITLAAAPRVLVVVNCIGAHDDASAGTSPECLWMRGGDYADLSELKGLLAWLLLRRSEDTACGCVTRTRLRAGRRT